MAEDILARIRVAEMEAAQRLDEARKDSEVRVNEARKTAKSLIEEAVRRGQATSVSRYEDRVAAAESEAQRIRAEAQAQAARSRSTLQPRVDELAEALVGLVTRSQGERGM